VIAERIGWPHSTAPLRKRLAVIRPEYAGINPVDRVSYQPGQLTQCDLWFPEPRIPVAACQQRVLGDDVGVLPVHDRHDDPVRQAGDIWPGCGRWSAGSAR
jgi:hypothetical protein